jgi:hypothetical protein
MGQAGVRRAGRDLKNPPRYAVGFLFEVVASFSGNAGKTVGVRPGGDTVPP